MDRHPSAPDGDTLRRQLQAPDPMQRANALHSLEMEVERGARRTLVHEVQRFTERGIPFYALNDPHFQQWVDKAVSYWQRLRAAQHEPRDPVGNADA